MATISFLRSHLREIRDRSVLRLFESNEVAAPQVLPGGAGVPQPLPSNGTHWEPATDNVSWTNAPKQIQKKNL